MDVAERGEYHVRGHHHAARSSSALQIAFARFPPREGLPNSSRTVYTPLFHNRWR